MMTLKPDVDASAMDGTSTLPEFEESSESNPSKGWRELRTEIGPDGVLLWTPRTKEMQPHGDLRLFWLVQEQPDMEAWQHWGYRWMSIVYDREYRKAVEENKRGFQVAARLCSDVVKSLELFFYKYLGERIDGGWTHPKFRSDPIALLTPCAEENREFALRDDFWEVCCQPLMKRKKRPDGRTYQWQSGLAATHSRNISDFFKFSSRARLIRLRVI